MSAVTVGNNAKLPSAYRPCPAYGGLRHWGRNLVDRTADAPTVFDDTAAWNAGEKACVDTRPLAELVTFALPKKPRSRTNRPQDVTAKPNPAHR